ncbi:MAG: Tryptophanyl-tRNA synthetase [Candidatus Woesebacteria bacterium GW2011_GWA1_40_45]|uniref:Tryptophan--tRNA ligase n=3 Tax=Candidatus Woeseibacteriota TaxID=1752722 RepID=A0A0G0SEV9_9BACT|nr:MAG: Tryptophanyl-tRNA synthetase [Candidatus Woesebacteria bacterium GW2011_GWA1_40_45]
MSMNKKRVLSGIRATGRLHLGNYLGAVKGMLALQEDSEYETFYMVADLHTLTTPYDKEKLQENTRNVILDYLAAGLDPEKSTIFVQSHIPEHTELAFLFSTVVSIARMQHLPTYKEKVMQNPEHNTMALLNYPVLMAADILIYKADSVPVGIDQEPHLEVSREVARKMNDTYGTDFPEPKRFVNKSLPAGRQGEYVPSLTGEGKMSKSVEGSYINLTDDLETIRKKLASAPTDSGRGKKVPTAGGVANLLKFVELFEGEDRRKEYEKAYSEKGIAYSELKEELAKAIYKELQPIQKKRVELEKNPEYVDKVLKDGAEKARKVAQETVKEVRKKMGLS